MRELYAAMRGKANFKKLIPDMVQEHILPHKKEVIAWFNSAKFAKLYSGHPYPPFLDPDEVVYEAIPPVVAWSLNLPLPACFDFCYISSHGAGSSGFFALLGVLGAMPIPTKSLNATGTYEELYFGLLKRKQWCDSHGQSGRYRAYLSLKNIPILDDAEKFLALIPPKPAILFVRDPISVLKTLLNVNFEAKNQATNKELNLKEYSILTDPKLIFDRINQFGFFNRGQSAANIEELPFMMNFSTYAFHDAQMIDALKSIKAIEILEMDAIMPQNAAKTMKRIAQKYSLKMPNELFERVANIRVSSYEIGLPINVFAHKSMIDRFSLTEWANDYEYVTDSFNFVFGFSWEASSFAVNVTKTIFDNEDDLFPFGIFTHELHLPYIRESAEDFVALKPYLKAYFTAMRAAAVRKSAEILGLLLKEGDILDYFRQNPQTAQDFKEICEQHLGYLKATKPKIMEKWKHYNEFLEIVGRG